MGLEKNWEIGGVEIKNGPMVEWSKEEERYTDHIYWITIVVIDERERKENHKGTTNTTTKKTTNRRINAVITIRSR